MEPIQIFSVLRNVTLIQVTTTHLTNSHPAESAKSTVKGRGHVNVEHLTDGHLLFHERGVWDASNVTFSNIYDWNFDGLNQKIRLGHRRFGLQFPEPLVDFSLNEEKHFEAKCPYFCGEDRYEAKLEVNLGHSVVRLFWTVIKPKFSYSLLNEYFCEPRNS